MAAARLERRFASVARSEARCRAPAKVGRAIAMRSPMINTTTISSIRVNPASLLLCDLIVPISPHSRCEQGAGPFRAAPHSPLSFLVLTAYQVPSLAVLPSAVLTLHV